MSPHQDSPASFDTPPSMGRRRTVNHDLLPRMARKGDVLYHISPDASRKWTRLGTNPAEAAIKYGQLEKRYQGAETTLADLIRRHIERRAKSLSDGTKAQYASYLRLIEREFPYPVAQLTSKDVAMFQESHADTPGYTNGCLSLIRAACKYGHRLDECGLITVEMFDMEARDRLISNEEFVRIRAKAEDWLKVAMNLAYYTGARLSDIRNLKWDRVGETLFMRQIKTGQRIEFPVTPEIEETLAMARSRRILGLYVVANSRGRRVGETAWGAAWHAAREAAGVEYCQFRDIRAKAGTTADEDGQDATKLLGHTNRKQTQRYIRHRKTIVAEPVRRKL